MSIVSFATQSIVRQRAQLVDDVDGSNYGNTAEDWTTPDEATYDSVTVQPVAVDELRDAARDAVLRRWQVIGGIDLDVTAADRIVWAGATYEVAGEPQRFTTGILDHVEFFMTDVRG